jgi:nicotinamide phosphoribosyltransferase
MLELIKPFNIILWCDTYKFGHVWQMPHRSKRLVAAVVPRKAASFTDEIVAMGQTFLSHVFATARLEQWMIDEAEVEVTEQGYQFNREGWEYILRTYNGRIPLTFYGVEEGRVVKPQTPILLVTHSDEKTKWLVPYFEPVIQSTVWSMSTTASICRYMRKVFAKYIKQTGGNVELLSYLVHFFGDRGANSPDETPVLKGMAHAALFKGSDCGRANGYIKRLYSTNKPRTSSVEATEHTTMCLNSDSETKDDYGAMEMVMELLERVAARSKTGIGLPIASAVPDTYDDERFVRKYIPKFKDRILASGARLVVRPDSGDPKTKLAQVLGWLEESFGSTTNEAGYRNLPWSVGALYGDGIDVESFESIIQGAVNAGWCTDNFLLGCGGGLANDGSRDWFSFSMKTVASYEEGRWKGVLKEPKSDIKKKSLSGLVRCREDENGELEVYDAINEHSLYSFFTPGPGHRLWLSDGYREWRQKFEEDVCVRAISGID